MHVPPAMPAMQVINPVTGRPLSIRVGIHSGRVMSGIVGSCRARYCLFGGERRLQLHACRPPAPAVRAPVLWVVEAVQPRTGTVSGQRGVGGAGSDANRSVLRGAQCAAGRPAAVLPISSPGPETKPCTACCPL